MDQAVRIAIQEDNRRDDIFGWEPCRSVRTHCRSCDGGDEVVIIHLEHSVPYAVFHSEHTKRLRDLDQFVADGFYHGL